MKQLSVFITTFVLGGLSLLPAASKAEDLDDLEVTMEVVDNIEGIMDVVIEMPGPEAADGTDTEGGETAGSADEEPAEESGCRRASRVAIPVSETSPGSNLGRRSLFALQSRRNRLVLTCHRTV
jgi:hypothetical protein